MLRVWQVLARVVGGVEGLPAAARAQRGEVLLAGARRYLEDNCVAYMQKVVAAHRAQVGCTGGGLRRGRGGGVGGWVAYCGCALLVKGEVCLAGG